MNLLTIAGSDPSSGAGIQGDVKTFSALDAYGLSVVTAVTSQNTSGFFDAKAISPSLVRNQIRAVLEDFHISSIKIGMVYDRQTIIAIHSELKDLEIPIVLDPVFKSTTGGILQKANAFLHFKKFLIPLANIITPNIMEAEKISKIKIKTTNDLRNAALKIQKMGSRNVVIKGGHLHKSNKVTDLLLEDTGRFSTFSHKRMSFESHGGGCNFSAALCVSIARGKKIHDAVNFARLYTLESMRNAKKISHGIRIVSPHRNNDVEFQLQDAISKFVSIRRVHEYIPEVQTNFVYSVSRPSSIDDILGIDGRIVRTGKSVTVAGELRYGGSRHVASALLEMSRKFPDIRSAINIKYEDRMIKRYTDNGFKVSSYDRRLEPHMIQDKEGKTVSWGIKEAIKNMRTPPDIIYHKGAFGKEPITLIFGKSPTEVLKKFLSAS